MTAARPGTVLRRRSALPTLLLCGLALGACGSGPDDADDMDMGGGSEPAERQEFAFAGTVEQIDRTTGVVAVAGEAVPGWMMAMTMSYYLEPAEVLEELEPGDRITAKVYSGDFQHLYEVQVVREPVAGAR